MGGAGGEGDGRSMGAGRRDAGGIDLQHDLAIEGTIPSSAVLDEQLQNIQWSHTLLTVFCTFSFNFQHRPRELLRLLSLARCPEPTHQKGVRRRIQGRTKPTLSVDSGLFHELYLRLHVHRHGRPNGRVYPSFLDSGGRGPVDVSRLLDRRIRCSLPPVANHPPYLDKPICPLLLPVPAFGFLGVSLLLCSAAASSLAAARSPPPPFTAVWCGGRHGR